MKALWSSAPDPSTPTSTTSFAKANQPECLGHTGRTASVKCVFRQVAAALQVGLLGVKMMKTQIGGLAILLGVFSASVSAEVFLNVNGKEYTLTALMDNCQSMGDNPGAQVACFKAVSDLLEQQTAEPAVRTSTTSVPEALDALRAVAEYEDAESGLIITGQACEAQVVYYANYFHISRRNVSSIDLYSVELDVSNIDFDQVVQSSGGNASMAKGSMFPGAVASAIGGTAMESAQYDFAAKSARTSLAEYAVEVAGQLKPNESGEFDFVLVHPAKAQSSAEIWNAFEAYTQACQS